MHTHAYVCLHHIHTRMHTHTRKHTHSTPDIFPYLFTIVSSNLNSISWSKIWPKERKLRRLWTIFVMYSITTYHIENNLCYWSTVPAHHKSIKKSLLNWSEFSLEVVVYFHFSYRCGCFFLFASITLECLFLALPTSCNQSAHCRCSGDLPPVILHQGWFIGRPPVPC